MLSGPQWGALKSGVTPRLGLESSGIPCGLSTGPFTRVYKEHSHVASHGLRGSSPHGDLGSPTSSVKVGFSQADARVHTVEPVASCTAYLRSPLCHFCSILLVHHQNPSHARRKLDSASWHSIIRQRVLLQPSLENTMCYVWQFLYFL